MTRRTMEWSVLAVVLVAGSSCTGRRLDSSLTWVGDNSTHLDEMLAGLGKDSSGFNASRAPVAVFDWDNTVIKNDVGDATMFWMIRHDKVLQPPNKDWGVTSPFLTSAAKTTLASACASLADPGAPLPTSTNTACADEVLSVYNDGTTTGGAAAFDLYNHRTMEPAYAWTVQLEAGYTPDEIRSFAEAAITENLAAAEGATQTVGSQTVNGYVRIYPQIEDLIGALGANGFDVWVVSASSQYAVEPFAARLGVAADHVVGIRAVQDAGGKLTYNLQGCGDIPDGTNDGAGNFTGNSLITYIEGKRCWINEVIYGETGAAARARNTEASKRIAFGAGDSDTDVSFLQDATALRLVINRNKKELMCNAYQGLAGGKWIVNPMFISPKPKLDTGYPCSTTACKDAAGSSVPCLDENGAAIPDQQDTVYCQGGTYCG